MRPSNKRALNTNIPENLASELDKFCEMTGFSKTQVVMSSLQQFMALKREELSLREDHPNNRIRSRLVMEVMPNDDEEDGKMASMLMY